MKAKHLEALMMSMEYCDTFLEYLVVLRVFLSELNHDVNLYTIDDIVYNSIRELSNAFNLKTLKQTIVDDKGKKSEIIYQLDGKYEPTMSFFELGENVRICVGKPSFNPSDLSQTNDIMTSIKYIETLNGDRYKISELSSTKANDESMSDLDAFMSYIDMDMYQRIMDVIDNDDTSYGVVCHIMDGDEVIDCKVSRDYILIIKLLINSFLRGDLYVKHI